ncbi:MAG TPA: hypothetical protein PKE29_12670, partial [Phycisphaerales bacterium]|nr:hypothetical protein [Phycisphaerales bacterium]
MSSTLMLWALPVALWALATGYSGFDLGKYSDDWSQSFINPSNGSVDAAFHPWVRWPYFFRPLYFVVIWGINTAFWERDWVRHAICAMVHLGVGALLFRVLRRIGVSAGVAIAGVTVFLVWPLNGEAVLWPAAIGLPLGAAAWLAGCSRAVAFARQTPDGRPWWRVAELGAWAFVAACFHEQAAAATAGVGALYLGCCAKEQGWGLRVRRAALATVGCGAGCAMYGALLMATAPRGRRGSMGSLVGAETLGSRVEQFAARAGDWVWGTRGQGVAIEGAMEGAKIVGSGVSVWMWGPFGVLGAVLWAVGFSGVWKDSAPPLRPPHRAGGWMARTGWLVVFGVVGAAASLLPVMVTQRNSVASRYFYVLVLGVCFAGAVGVDGFARWVGERMRGVVVGMAMGVAGVVGVWGAMGMVWWQQAFRARAEAERVIGEQLRWAVATPVEGAVVVPVSIARARPALGEAFPEGPVPGAMTQSWACWGFVQKTFGRGDMS